MKLSEYLSQRTPEGQRNDFLFQAVLQMRETGQNCIEDIRAAAQRDGLKASEINATIKSAMQRPIVPKRKYDRNEIIGFYGTIDNDWTPGECSAPPVNPLDSPGEMWDTEDCPRFLRTLFSSTEHVSYCLGNKHGKPTDKRTKLCSALLDAHDPTEEGELRTTGDIIRVANNGAWVCVNPCDGHGREDSNVTDFRYTLIEADSLELQAQLNMISRWRLPYVTLVHSGARSIHAIVRIDAGKRNAANYKDVKTDPAYIEYEKRVKFLISKLTDLGYAVDPKNKNPSRLSRLPGVMRGDSPQYLIATNNNPMSWAEWTRWIETQDNYPEPESFETLLADPPPLRPEIIQGILRRGHKLMLAGPSKAGKSYALIQLAAAVAGGTKWWGTYLCTQGRVLYVNLEIDRASFVQRLILIHERMPFDPANLYAWNLRGAVRQLDELAKRLRGWYATKPLDLLILDPIYKTNDGDENSARDMTRFCNVIESIAEASGAAVVFAHHFSKGAQGGKASIDRASGSGVLGRDPDAIVALTEVADDHGEIVPNGYRLDWTLREFATPPEGFVRWEWPMHYPAADLDGLRAVGAVGRPKKGNINRDSIIFAAQILDIDQTGKVSLNMLMDYFAVSKNTIIRRLKEAKIPVQNAEIETEVDKDA